MVLRLEAHIIEIIPPYGVSGKKQIEMDYQLIYQYTPTYSNVWHIFPLLVFVLVAILLIVVIKKYYIKRSFVRQLTLFFGYILLIISSIMTFIMLLKLPEIIASERQLKNALYNNKSSVVEGKIENYSQQKINGRIYEKFEIDSVQFELSNNLDIEGFPNKTKIKTVIERYKKSIFKIEFIKINGEIRILKIEEKLKPKA